MVLMVGPGKMNVHYEECASALVHKYTGDKQMPSIDVSSEIEGSHCVQTNLL